MTIIKIFAGTIISVMLNQRHSQILQGEQRQVQRTRRVSKSFIEATSAPGADTRLIERIEENPLFQELSAAGLIRKNFISSTSSNNYLVEQAVRFVQEHQLDRQPDWDYVLNKSQSEDWPKWAQRWCVPRTELRRALSAIRGNEKRVSREVSLDDLPARSEPRSPNSVETADASDRTNSKGHTLTSEKLLAVVSVAPDGQLNINLRARRAVACYSIPDEAVLNGWLEAHQSKIQYRSLEEDMHTVNEISQQLNAVLNVICQKQKAFLASGDSSRLAPLQQADVAREAGCDPSFVSRYAGDIIETPHGRYLVSELLLREQDAVGRVADAHPEWSANQIADYLANEYGLQMSRQSVSRHRIKWRKKQKASLEDQAVKAKINELLENFELTTQQFAQYFLSGDYELWEIIEETGCSRIAAESLAKAAAQARAVLKPETEGI